MSKRKAVSFLEEFGDDSESKSKEAKHVASRFKEKHSLDSDEEDTKEKYDVLDADEIEGQEETEVDIEEGVRFTAFNMREEMEEGHFDTEGTYIFKKGKEIQDNWIDNIDWAQVKQREKSNEADDSSDEEAPRVDEISYYKQMLELMKPGETVLKALRRLGGGKPVSASARWKSKKTKTNESTSADDEKTKKDKENLLVLTGLADKLLTQGELEIYQYTYEKLGFLVKNVPEESKFKKTEVPEGTTDDDAMDMFAESFDKQEGGTHTEEKPQESQPKSEEPAKSASEVRWEYKWENKEEAEVHGPFTSEEMLEWQEDGFFKDGVVVRKVNESNQGEFYSSRRIDFDLYT